MKCPNCGTENSESVIRCVDCGEHLKKRADVHKTSAPTQLDAQISNAINIRRLAIAVVLGVFLIAGTALVTLMITTLDMDLAEKRSLVEAWSVIAGLAMVFGGAIFVFSKHPTRPSEPVF